jgi:GNAT superfamily N-acetyltransferase
MEEHVLSVEEQPSDEDSRFVSRGLYEFNLAETGVDVRNIAVFVRDKERNIIGGTLGWTSLELLHINILWVHAHARGQGYGKRILLAAEEEGAKRGCRQANLDTFSFQAPGFYQKLGYQVFGKIDVTSKYVWYFLKKDISNRAKD